MSSLTSAGPSPSPGITLPMPAQSSTPLPAASNMPRPHLKGLPRATRMSVAEASRVSALIEQAQQKIALLSMVSSGTGPADDSKDENGNSKEDKSGPMARLLEEQKAAQARYEALLDKRVESISNQNDNTTILSYSSNEKKQLSADELAELRETQELLKQLTKKLCRSLRETPDDADNWKKISRERNEVQTALQACFREFSSNLLSAVPPAPTSWTVPTQLSLRNSPAPASPGGSTGGPQESSRDGALSAGGSQSRQRFSSVFASNSLITPTTQITEVAPKDVFFDTFAKRVNDAVTKREWAKEVVEKEKSVQQEVKELRYKLMTETEERQKMLKERGSKMAALKQEVASLILTVRVDNEKLKKERDALSESDRRKELATIADLTKRLERLEIELNVEHRAHQTLAKFFDDKNNETRLLLDGWNSRYEQETAELERELEQRTRDRAQQEQRLAECEKRYQEELEDEARRQEEARIEAEKEAERKRQALRVDAAGKIQTAWREYVARKKAAKKKAKGKKEKGDKKKKK